jgi:hypothetical protein
VLFMNTVLLTTMPLPPVMYTAPPLDSA